jgi:hypothetical protein
MKQTRRNIILFIILLSCSYSVLFAQNESELLLKESVDSIDAIFNQIAVANCDGERLRLNNYIRSYMELILQEEDADKILLDTVGNLSVLTAPGNDLKIYTWNLYFDDGSYKYYGYLLHGTKKDKELFALEDFSNDTSCQRTFSSHKEWYGALYYKIIEKKWNSKTYYVLIGWDGADKLINRKVIETLQFTRKGLPEFGLKYFRQDRKKKGRLIYEYAENTSMLLRYNEKHDMIVIDHLVPTHPRFTDMYQYYGPDLTYDAFEYKAGNWWYVENVDPDKAINFKKNKKVEKIKNNGFSNNF